MCSKGCARCLLFVFNVVFWLAGAGLLGIGIWMKVDRTIVNYLLVVNIDQSDPLVDHAAWLFIGVGGLMFVVGFFGCCGALRESQGMLFIYALLLLVIMAAQVAGAVMVLMYRGKISRSLKESMQRQVREEYTVEDSPTKSAWDFLQHRLKCCAANNYTEWRISHWANQTQGLSVEGVPMHVPLTCCLLKNDDYKNPEPDNNQKCQADAAIEIWQSEQLHTRGCYYALNDWFRKHSFMLMLLGFAVAGSQILGFVLACCLRQSLKKEQLNKYQTA